LKENQETEALVALNRPNIARLNEIMVNFTLFIKCVQGNSILCFDILLMVKLGSLRVNQHAETLMQNVSGRFSWTRDLDVMFVCCLAAPAGKNIMALLSDQARSPQARKHCDSRASIHRYINPLANVFS
jgi:hypothetical protein